jgi:hypothetical protein
MMAYLLIKQTSNDLATLNPDKGLLFFVLMLIIKCKKLLLILLYSEKFQGET